MEDALETSHHIDNLRTEPLKSISNREAEKLLRQTLRLKTVRTPTFMPDITNPQKVRLLPRVIVSMHKNKTDLQLTMCKNHGKLNASFSGYLQSEMGLARDELRKKKITKKKKV